MTPADVDACSWRDFVGLTMACDRWIEAQKKAAGK